MNKRLISGVVIVSLLAGCTVGPKYRKPIVQPPSTFRGAGDAAATPDPSSLADLKWFEVFKDEQLQELIRTALVNNYEWREFHSRENQVIKGLIGLCSSSLTTRVISRKRIAPIRCGAQPSGRPSSPVGLG